jgi:CPA1 family monovalent cation:H+ antiporter
MTVGLGQFDAVYNILILVVIITLIARQFKFPSTIALIFAGIFAAYTPRFNLPEISPEIFLALLLPPILFEETLTMDVEGLIDDSDTILSYALGGTIIMVCAVAVYTHYLINLTWLEAFLIGIIIAPTDPVSVTATFKRLGVIRRFQLIVAGESLFNDGIAIVIYTILVAIVSAGTISFLDILQISALNVMGGIILGTLAGYVVHLIFCWTDDIFAEILLSFIVTFGVFRLAEIIQASGVIAVVIAGLLLNYRCRTHGGISDEMQETLEVMWRFVGFIASSFAFIFIGISIEPKLLRDFALPIIGLALFSIGYRYIMVNVIASFLERYRRKRLPLNWRIGMTWSGLKGAVSIVLVLGITSLGLPNTDIMVALTYGLVISSTIVQGLSMSNLVNQYRLLSRSPIAETRESD